MTIVKVHHWHRRDGACTTVWERHRFRRGFTATTTFHSFSRVDGEVKYLPSSVQMEVRSLGEWRPGSEVPGWGHGR